MDYLKFGHHLDSLVSLSLLIGVGNGQPTQQTPWIVLQVLACSCKHPLNESQAQQPVNNSPPTNQSCWGSTDWSGRSTSQIGQWGVIQPEILCLWVWSVVWPLVAHSQELRYHAELKIRWCFHCPSMPTLLSQQHLAFSSLCCSCLNWKGLRYIQGNERTTHLCTHSILHTLNTSHHTPLYTPHSALHTSHTTLHTLHTSYHSTPYIHTPHSTLHTLHCTLYTWHTSLHTPHCTFTLYTPQSTLLTLHCTLHTPHSKLCTKHSTLHTLHFTLYTSHSTFHTLHFTRHTIHFTLHSLHSTLSKLPTLHFTLYTHTLHSTLSTLHFTLHIPHFTLHSTLSTLHSHLTIHTPHFTLNTLHFTLHTPHFTLHTLHFTSHIPHYTLHTPHRHLMLVALSRIPSHDLHSGSLVSLVHFIALYTNTCTCACTFTFAPLLITFTLHLHHIKFTLPYTTFLPESKTIALNSSATSVICHPSIVRSQHQAESLCHTSRSLADCINISCGAPGQNSSAQHVFARKNM